MDDLVIAVYTGDDIHGAAEAVGTGCEVLADEISNQEKVSAGSVRVQEAIKELLAAVKMGEGGDNDE